MGIIRFAIENPVKIAVGVILVLLFGVLSVFRIPIQLTPDVDRPVITVNTAWPGASPQEIESEIIDRQEDKLKSVSNLNKMTSRAVEGSGFVRLEFPVTVDKDIAYRDVSDKLRQVTGYPEEVEEPVMAATDNDMANTIAWMMVYSQGDDRQVSRLKTFIWDRVKPILERADGIASVDVYGGLDREIQVEVDAHKLAARGLTLRDIEQALRRQNQNISAGTIRHGKRDYTYRTVGEYRTVTEIEDTIVTYLPGGPITVSDVATVIDGYKKQFGFVRSKGQFVIAMPARRETGANVMTAMANLKEQIAYVNKEILEPRGLGLELTQVYDETNYINGAIRLVVQNILIGGLMAITVLWLFLRSGSATGIVAVAIPICAVGTFLVITIMNRTLNVVMLAGLAFAVGMVVDNAIVVLENIYRHRAMGKTRVDAALSGAQEVWGAILASTLTTMAVFLPVIFIVEEAGQLFKDIAIAIASAVGISLVVSVIVIPPLASRFFSASRAQRAGGAKPWRMAILTSKLVGTINRSISARMATVFGISGLALMLSWWLMPAAEYLPAGNKNLVFGFLVTPPGYSVDEFKRMAKIVEEGDPDDPLDGIRPIWEADITEPESMADLPIIDIPLGKKGETKVTVRVPPILNFFFVSFDGGAFMGCTSQEQTNVKPLVQIMSKVGGRLPGVFAPFFQTSLFSGGLSSGNTVELEVRSDDYVAMTSAASSLVRKVMAVGYGYPRPEPSNFEMGRPEVQMIPDRAKAADLGLDVRDVGFIVEAAIDGAFVGEFNDSGDKIDMVIKLADTEDATVEEVGQVPICTPTGHVVPIASAVDIKRTTGPQQINHIEEMKSVTLQVKPKTGVPLQETMRELEQDVIMPLRESGAIPPNVITTLAGNADKLTQTQKALVGDFKDTLPESGLFGLPYWASPFLLIFGVLLLSWLLGVAIHRRAATWCAIVGSVLVILGFMVMNPSFVVEMLQSRALLALLITYLLMAALFESFAYPFVIMFSVPLAAVGGFAALHIVHRVSLMDVSSPIQQLDVLTMLGFVILIGIVVNNAILIVHQALTYMRRDSLSSHEAVTMSVQTRTRPIFMSALTSIFGMAPLVFMTGPGSELYRGLGSVVLGGLLVSTLFTLVVVPAMFTLFLDLQRWVATQATPSGTQRAGALGGTGSAGAGDVGTGALGQP
ncbi:MAG: efflux RND transporter permease subunit [Planctomycetota bacterium]